jgi:hypothetical protein
VFRKQFSEVEDACALAQAMVDTVREPLIVLDKDLPYERTWPGRGLKSENDRKLIPVAMLTHK